VSSSKRQFFFAENRHIRRSACLLALTPEASFSKQSWCLQKFSCLRNGGAYAPTHAYASFKNSLLSPKFLRAGQPGTRFAWPTPSPFRSTWATPRWGRCAPSWRTRWPAFERFSGNKNTDLSLIFLNFLIWTDFDKVVCVFMMNIHHLVIWTKIAPKLSKIGLYCMPYVCQNFITLNK
jgi:hypothetical protein